MLYLIYIIYYVNIYCYILNFIVKLGLFLLIRTATGAPVISSLGVQMVWLQFMGILLIVDNYNRSY